MNLDQDDKGDDDKDDDVEDNDDKEDNYKMMMAMAIFHIEPGCR